MVRLRDQGHKLGTLCFWISIPIWCDWENPVCHKNTVYLTISIPIWCDWEAQMRFNFVNISPISIPIWCDWESTRPPHCPIFTFISIPIWCDWEMHIPISRLQSFPFQFQYGAIERVLDVRSWSGWANFNSNMVRLRVGLQMAKTSAEIFQFQYGAIESRKYSKNNWL